MMTMIALGTLGVSAMLFYEAMTIPPWERGISPVQFMVPLSIVGAFAGAFMLVAEMPQDVVRVWAGASTMGALIVLAGEYEEYINKQHYEEREKNMQEANEKRMKDQKASNKPGVTRLSS
jgi:DMSO reductase anchor subunit